MQSAPAQDDQNQMPATPPVGDVAAPAPAPEAAADMTPAAPPVDAPAPTAAEPAADGEVAPEAPMAGGPAMPSDPGSAENVPDVDAVAPADGTTPTPPPADPAA